MRFTHFSPFALVGLLSLAAWGQSPAAMPQTAPQDRLEQSVQTIHLEDAGTQVDEVRIGGETKSITVQPKAHVPPYELGAEGGNRNPSASPSDSGKGGSSGWKILGF
jgi:hypothetical protein